MSRSYRILRRAVRLLLHAFFHRIEISGLDNVPASGGGIVVAWHPNALVDPALIFISFPRTIAFGARHGIFRWPVIGRIVRAIGTVPIFRAQDLSDPTAEEARRRANRMSLDAMATAVAAGKFTALFPEGLSHDDPGPRSLKTGVAQIFYRAFEQTQPNRPVLLPVGLHYERKGILGSRALIVYHPPLELSASLVELPPAGLISPEARRLRCKALTLELENCLRNIVYATENWELHDLLHRARQLVRAERAARAGSPAKSPTMAEQILGFRRLWMGYHALRETHRREVESLQRRVRRYDTELTSLGLEDHELDAATSRVRSWIRGRLLLRTLLILILSPLAVLGYVVNLPPAAIVWWIDKRRSRQEKDQATIKLLAGAATFPIAWLVAAILVSTRVGDSPGTVASVLGGIAAFLGSAISGLLILNYQRLVVETLRGLRLHYRHRRHNLDIQELRAERRSICLEVEALARGLDLPGTLLADGTLLESNSSCPDSG